MVATTRKLIWQVPLTMLVCIAASLAGVWLVSRAMEFAMNPSVVVLLSVVLSAAAIAAELRGRR